MGHQLWIPDRCREYGLDVTEVDGWQARGSDAFTPYGVVCHHTAGPATGEIPSLRTLILGRSDLAGPLCNVALGRSGRVYVVAAGRANHAGAGGWRGLVGNSSVLGIEAEDDGDGTWTNEQRRAYPILAAALESGCRKVDFAMICGHLEWAPKRKIDPRGINMVDLRAAASAYHHPAPPAPAPPPAPAITTATYEESDVQTKFVTSPPANGLGLAEFPVDFGREVVPVGEPCVHGPDPSSGDGWWPDTIGVTARAQPRGTGLYVTVAGIRKAGVAVQLWVSAAPAS